MPEPRDEDQWPSGQLPTPQDGPHSTGPVVSYNAAAFDAEAEEQQPASHAPTGPAEPGGLAAPSAATPAPPYPAASNPAAPYAGPHHPESYRLEPHHPEPLYPAPQYGLPQTPMPHNPMSENLGQAAVGGSRPPVAPQAAGRRSRKPLWFGAAGAVALVAALIAGYFVFFTFGGIANSHGKIANAQAFADDATEIWKASLPEEGISVGADAGCYYVLNANQRITNELACGPVLRVGVDPERVWDFYQFTVSGSGNEQIAEGLSAVPTLNRSAPQNGSIVDVDGNQPDDGSQLPTPSLPRAEQNGVWVAGDFTADPAHGTSIELAADPRLVAPSAQVVVEQIAEHDSVTIDGQLKRAAEGQKLLRISLSGDTGPVAGEMTSVLRVDLAGTELTVHEDPAALGATELLVSVPTDGESYLVLETEGHQQRLDLATGTRTANSTTEIYYTGEAEPSVELSEKLSLPPIDVTDAEEFGMELTFAAARMTPYLQGYGWAPANHHWLIVDISHSATTNLGAESTFQYYTLDCAASLVSFGTTHSCKSDTGGQNTATWVAAVEAGATYFAISYAVTLDAWGEDQPNVVVDFEPTQVTISFD